MNTFAHIRTFTLLDVGYLQFSSFAPMYGLSKLIPALGLASVIEDINV